MANGRTLEQAEKQLALLAAENRRLAAELEGLQNQGVALEKAARDARAGQAAAEKAAAALKNRIEIADKQSADILAANKVLTAQAAVLNKQVTKTPFNPLTVEEASVLFDRVIGAFQNSKTLEVKQASLNLKLATAKLGDTTVLLLPDPKAADAATLHELRLDLTAAVQDGGASEPAARPAPPKRPTADPAERPAPKPPRKRR